MGKSALVTCSSSMPRVDGPAVGRRRVVERRNEWKDKQHPPTATDRLCCLLLSPAVQQNITRSPEEAEEILRSHMTALGSNPTPEKFAELASVHS